MSERFITSEQVDRALHWITDNSLALAQAKGELIKAQHMVKVALALEMKKHDGPVSKAEVLARSSENYQAAIMAEVDATIAYEKLRNLQAAASQKIDIWRTQESNVRAMKL